MAEALDGLAEYLKVHYQQSVFDTATPSAAVWEIHVHGPQVLVAAVVAAGRYDITIRDSVSGAESVLPKLQITCVYRTEAAESIRALLKTDLKVQAQGLAPIASPVSRHHVKNKSLYPLMMDREVLLFTLLDGAIIRGIVAGFSRYEITVLVKGGHPVTVMRHAIYDVRDKKNRSYLKSYQQTHQDWRKSEYFRAA